MPAEGTLGGSNLNLDFISDLFWRLEGEDTNLEAGVRL